MRRHRQNPLFPPSVTCRFREGDHVCVPVYERSAQYEVFQVSKVTETGYLLEAPKARPIRRRFDLAEQEYWRLPRKIPYQPFKDFCALRFTSCIAYLGRIWVVGEAGFTEYVYSQGKVAPIFSPTLAWLADFPRELGQQYGWFESLGELLSYLAQIARQREKEVGITDDLLREPSGKPWLGEPISSGTSSQACSWACDAQHRGLIRKVKAVGPKRIIWEGYEWSDAAGVCSLPEAFPAAIVPDIGRIHEGFRLGPWRFWMASGRRRFEFGDISLGHPFVLLSSTLDWQFEGWPILCYFSHDRIVWYRCLSHALEELLQAEGTRAFPPAPSLLH